MKTLYKVSETIIDKKIDFCETSDYNLVEMLNAHGLLCSPDDTKYTENKCPKRQYENESGKKKLFDIHLKPATETNKYDEESCSLGAKAAVRIYLEWDKEKKIMRLGWIGRHPVSCGKCSNKTCKANPEYLKKS